MENVRLTREKYEELLSDLILAVVKRRGEMTVMCLTEMVNQEIVQNGIIGAADRVRAAR